MIGRNDVCPCGSGKKYKKCCLNKDMMLDRSNKKVSNSQKQYAELYAKLYEYSRQDKFYEEYKKAREAFYIIQDDEINKKFDKFFNTYFIQDHIMESKKVLTADFYEDNKDDLSTPEVEILRSLFESFVSIYSVKEKREDKIILTDELLKIDVEVDDLNLLKEFNVGDSLIARIIEVDGVNMLLDITISITDSVKEVITNDINNFFKQYEDVYKDMKTFLLYYTNVLYKYIQQLLEPTISEHLKSKNNSTEKAEEPQEKKKEIKSDNKVEDLLKENVNEEYLEQCLNAWESYKSNNDIKGVETGWAAAVEYHIKKSNSEVVTQTQVAQKYGISASTLGKRYKDLKI